MAFWLPPFFACLSLRVDISLAEAWLDVVEVDAVNDAIEDGLAVDCAAGVDAGAVEIGGQFEAKRAVGTDLAAGVDEVSEAELEGQSEVKRALGPGEAFSVEVEVEQSKVKRSATQLLQRERLFVFITASLTTEAKVTFFLEIHKARLRKKNYFFLVLSLPLFFVWSHHEPACHLWTNYVENVTYLAWSNKIQPSSVVILIPGCFKRRLTIFNPYSFLLCHFADG